MRELYTSSGVLTREACHLCAVKIGVWSDFAIIIIKLLLFPLTNYIALDIQLK